MPPSFPFANTGVFADRPEKVQSNIIGRAGITELLPLPEPARGYDVIIHKRRKGRAWSGIPGTIGYQE
jgi:hypothetical protein